MENIKIFDKSGIQDLKRADIGSAGVDIRSNEALVIEPGERKVVMTGLHTELPIGMELQIRSRSGLAVKNGIFVLNSPGTIDSTFRGQIGVILQNMSNSAFHISIGDRIAQGVFAKYEIPEIIYVESIDELSATERGSEGFGHSGIK